MAEIFRGLLAAVQLLYGGVKDKANPPLYKAGYRPACISIIDVVEHIKHSSGHEKAQALCYVISSKICMW